MKRRNESWSYLAVGLVLVLAFSLVSLVMVARARWRTELSAKARGEPLANMSHEIHTPRNGIPGMTELTLATHLDPEQHEYIRTAQDSGRGLPKGFDPRATKSLGFQIIRTLSEQLRASLETSPQAVGACISITFKLGN